MAPQIRLPPVGVAAAPNPAAAAPAAPPAPAPDPADVLHRVWVGGRRACPKADGAFGRGFDRLNPGCELREWTDADLESLDPRRGRVRAPCAQASELSHLGAARSSPRPAGSTWTPTSNAGGRSRACWRGVEAFAALERPGRVGTAVPRRGAGPPGLPPCGAGPRARRSVSARTRPTQNGPYFFSLVLEQEPGVTIFGADKFYPYHWDEPERAGDAVPGRRSRCTTGR